MKLVFENVAVPIWPVALGLLLLLALRHWRRRHSPVSLLCFLLFGVYLLVALDLAYFPIDVTSGYAQARRQAAPWPEFNLVPLDFGSNSYPWLTLTLSLQNVLLTVPFGFGISFVAPLRGRDFRWLPLAVGVVLEGAQLVLSLLLRYGYRVIDVNDVLLNALGVWVGYALFRGFAWGYGRLAQRFGVLGKGWLGEVEAVVRGPAVYG